MVSDELRIYVSNRFQVNAYSNTDGRQLWAQGLGSEQGESYAMPFAPMKPLIAGDRLFVRRLTKAGAELACLKADDGQVVWHQRPSNGLLTDPVIWNGRLFATVLTKLDEDVTQVEATWFDSTNGDVLSTRPLFRLREAPERQFSGQMTISDRVAICTVAGTTACFDSRGEMRWLKRHTWLQKPTDELAEDHRVVAPVVKAGCVIATMPGVREVSCLDLDSGRTVWERPITDLRGLIDVNDSRVLVDTVAGLVALDAKSGQIAWSRPIETRLEGLTISGQTLMVARRGMLANNRSKPILLWLDIKTGEELGQSLVDVADREECQLGPMFSAGGKWWSFVGQTWKEPKRELHEFVAAPLAAPNSFVDETLQTWSPESLDGQFAEIESVVPSWFPVADYRERLVVHPGEIRGETFTLVSKLDAQHSVRWTRRLRLIAGQKPSLRLRVGNQPGQKWKLTVRTARQILMNQEIEDANGTNGWRDVTIDLSPLSGQDVSVYLIQATVADAAADALWKRAELIRE